MHPKKPRAFLTKSIFKIGLDCPRKLFYLNKPDEYLNNSVENSFLQALAQGGYQVGELAKLKYQNGIEIKSKEHQTALIETAEQLKADSSVVFEAAFVHDSFFVRSDIVIKAENSLRIVEVKSKSIDDDEEDIRFTSKKSAKTGIEILGKWKPYFYDLAFQTMVARLQFPNLKVSASLLLLDKSSVNQIDGLHQLFLVKKKDGSTQVITTDQVEKYFEGTRILREVDVTEEINAIIEGTDISEFHVQGSLLEKANQLSKIYLSDSKFSASNSVGSQCKKCEFKGSGVSSLKSGYDECWVEAANLEAASSKPMIFDVWDFRSSENAIKDRKYLMTDLDDADLLPKKSKKIEISERVARQLLQIEKVRNQDPSPWLDFKYLKDEMSRWRWPLHFVDFETCMPAIPFKKGFSPYSEIAFQFSHHIMQKDGSVQHIGEYINIEPGGFPSFDFLRELHSQLKSDDGTIFRYSSHENSVLIRIMRLLENSVETDKDELIRFIRSITVKKEKDVVLWQGDRNMVDLLKVVKSGYYSPQMKGSNSLKYVLPSILHESEFLKQKYSKPIYGTQAMPSKNYISQCWIRFDGKEYSSDPYNELPALFNQDELKAIDSIISEDDQIRNGGAAMMAYCKSQYSIMSEIERSAIRTALLKYCELDTLAMVMLVEYWRDVCKL